MKYKKKYMNIPAQIIFEVICNYCKHPQILDLSKNIRCENCKEIYNILYPDEVLIGNVIYKKNRRYLVNLKKEETEKIILVNFMKNFKKDQKF